MTPVIRTFSWVPEFARGSVGSASALGLPRQSQLILREPRRGTTLAPNPTVPAYASPNCAAERGSARLLHI